MNEAKLLKFIRWNLGPNRIQKTDSRPPSVGGDIVEEPKAVALN